LQNDAINVPSASETKIEDSCFYDKVECSIIIPVYNEEKRISECLNALCKENYEIIVSADGCDDRTVKIAKQFQVKITTFPERLGKGGGILNALELATNEIIIIMDADLSVSPNQISKLLAEISDADIVLGSRNLKDSRIPVKPPFYRRLLGRTFNWIFRKLFGLQFFDTQCGFKAVRKSVFEQLENDLYLDGFAFDINLIVKANERGYRIKEVPIEWSYKKGSKVNTTKQIYVMGKDLFTLWLETKKRKYGTSNLKRFYDSLNGDVYEKASKSPFLPRRWWHQHKNKEIVKYIEGKDILDAGCGSGAILEFLGHKKVTGVDIGRGFIQFCSLKYPHAKFYEANLEKLPFEDNSFDTVICSEVIEHLEHPEKAIREFRRVLRSNGELILTTPNFSFRWALIEAVWTRIRREVLEINHKAFTKRQLRRLLSKIDFHIQNNHVFMLGCLLFVKAKKN